MFEKKILRTQIHWNKTECNLSFKRKLIKECAEQTHCQTCCSRSRIFFKPTSKVSSLWIVFTSLCSMCCQRRDIKRKVASNHSRISITPESLHLSIALIHLHCSVTSYAKNKIISTCLPSIALLVFCKGATSMSCSDCPCYTCKNYTRAYISSIMVSGEEAACHLMSVHNIAYQLNLMRKLRESIIEDRFVQFVQNFMRLQFPNKDYPEWAVNALNKVNCPLL